MKRLHIHLHVEALDASIAYYERLFGVPPTRREAGYAQWLLDEPSVNLAVSQSADARGIGHLGIETDAEGLAALDAQAADAFKRETAANCCYARSDKTWTQDPDGVVWELFHTHDRDAKYARDEAQAQAAPCCA